MTFNVVVIYLQPYWSGIVYIFEAVNLRAKTPNFAVFQRFELSFAFTELFFF